MAASRLSLIRLIIILAAISAASGCAYFNLLYNAQSAFDAARQADSKRVLADSLSYAKPLPEAETLYKRAIEKASKVFEIYPKDRDWHDDALFIIARSYLYLRDQVAAIRRFKQLQQQYAGSPFVPPSYVLLGQAYLIDENYDKAEETVLYALKTWPSLNDNEELSLLLAQIAVKRQGKSMAVDILLEARKNIRDPLARMQIALQIASLYMDLGNFPAAIAILRAAPRNNDNPELLLRLDLCLVRALRAQKLFAEALSLTDRVLATNPPLRFRNTFLFEKAGLLAALMRYDEALGIYAKVAVADSQRLGGEAYFEQGELYLHKKSDYPPALDKYTRALTRLPDSVEHKAIAKRRIAAINTIIALRVQEKSAADTARTADTLHKKIPIVFAQSFDAAEMFWRDLNEPDSACRRFLLLAADSTADSGRGVARALYAAATVLRTALHDTSQSDSILRIILVRFSASEYAKRAMADRGDSTTMLTRRDSALAAYGAAEKLYFETGDTVGAVAAFLAVYTMYRDCDVAPQALYSAAWINDNILDKNVSARNQYQELCDTFPSSEWCVRGARARLKFVADTLSILKAKKSGKLPVATMAELSKAADSTLPKSTAPVPSSGVPGPGFIPGSVMRGRGGMNEMQREPIPSFNRDSVLKR